MQKRQKRQALVGRHKRQRVGEATVYTTHLLLRTSDVTLCVLASSHFISGLWVDR